MIYVRFKSEARVDPTGCTVLIGTEASFPRAIRNLQSEILSIMRAEILSEGGLAALPDGGRAEFVDLGDGEDVVSNVPLAFVLSQLKVTPANRSTISAFDVILQMEGGPAEYREIASRFAHLEARDHVFVATAELLAYIDEHFVPWTGENAVRIGEDPPKRSAEDRSAPLSRGLGERLKARRG